MGAHHPRARARRWHRLRRQGRLGQGRHLPERSAGLHGSGQRRGRRGDPVGRGRAGHGPHPGQAGRRQDRRGLLPALAQRRPVLDDPAGLLPAAPQDVGRGGPRRPDRHVEPCRGTRRHPRGLARRADRQGDRRGLGDPRGRRDEGPRRPEGARPAPGGERQPRGLPVPGDLHGRARDHGARAAAADGQEDPRRRERPRHRHPGAGARALQGGRADGREHPRVRGRPRRGLPQGRAGALQPHRRRHAAAARLDRVVREQARGRRLDDARGARQPVGVQHVPEHRPAARTDRLARGEDHRGRTEPRAGRLAVLLRRQAGRHHLQHELCQAHGRLPEGLRRRLLRPRHRRRRTPLS